MKIDHHELKALYKASLAAKIPSSRENCPSPQAIIKFLRSKAGRKKQAKIIDHISQCGRCAHEVEYVMDVFRSEKVLQQDIAELFSKLEGIDAKRRSPRGFFPRFSWKSLSLLASSLVLIFVILSLVIFKTPEKYRAESSVQVKLLQPVNKSVSRSQLVFKWKETEDAEYYILEIFDQSLYPIWKSDKIPTNHVALPEKSSQALAVNNSYFWMVSAHLSNGENIRSSLEEFSLKE